MEIRFSIGDVSSMLDVPRHILRYWEQESGILTPEKAKSGRRAYSTADLQILFRVRYLVSVRGVPIKQAARLIIAESGNPRVARVKAAVNGVRADLLELAVRTRREGDIAQPVLPDSAPVRGAENFFLGFDRREPTVQRRLLAAAEFCARNVPEDHGGLPSTPEPRVYPVYPRESVPQWALDAAETAYTNRHVAVITPPIRAERGIVGTANIPPTARFPDAEGVSLLERCASRVRAAAYRFGRAPLWILGCDDDEHDRFTAQLERNRYFGIRPEDVRVVRCTRVPVRDGDGRFILDPYFNPILRSTGDARVLREAAGLPRSFLYVVYSPIGNPVCRFPDVELLGAHIASRAALTLSATPHPRNPKLYLPTGVYICDTRRIASLELRRRVRLEVMTLIPGEKRDDCRVSEVLYTAYDPAAAPGRHDVCVVASSPIERVSRGADLACVAAAVRRKYTAWANALGPGYPSREMDVSPVYAESIDEFMLRERQKGTPVSNHD